MGAELVSLKWGAPETGNGCCGFVSVLVSVAAVRDRSLRFSSPARRLRRPSANTGTDECGLGKRVGFPSCTNVAIATRINPNRHSERHPDPGLDRYPGHRPPGKPPPHLNYGDCEDLGRIEPSTTIAGPGHSRAVHQRQTASESSGQPTDNEPRSLQNPVWTYLTRGLQPADQKQ